MKRRRLLSDAEIADLAKQVGVTEDQFRQSIAVHERDDRYLEPSGVATGKRPLEGQMDDKDDKDKPFNLDDPRNILSLDALAAGINEWHGRVESSARLTLDY